MEGEAEFGGGSRKGGNIRAPTRPALSAAKVVQCKILSIYGKTHHVVMLASGCTRGTSCPKRHRTRTHRQLAGLHKPHIPSVTSCKHRAKTTVEEGFRHVGRRIPVEHANIGTIERNRIVESGGKQVSTDGRIPTRQRARHRIAVRVRSIEIQIPERLTCSRRSEEQGRNQEMNYFGLHDPVNLILRL